MTIQESNKLIAVFMGGFIKEVFFFGGGGVKTLSFYLPTSDITDPIDDFLYQTPYHSSWDWLMPVVEKINKLHTLGHLITINLWTHASTAECKIYLNEIGESEIESEKNSLIETVYSAVFLFIEYYNQQKKSSPSE